MYGFEKLWAFLKFRKATEKLDLAADLQAELVKFKTADDFHTVAASLFSNSRLFCFHLLFLAEKA